MSRFFKTLLCGSGLASVVVALSLGTSAAPAQASNGVCEGLVCAWNCNPQAAESWCWFDAPGGENARNWFFNSAWDNYENHVWKCAAAIKASDGKTYSSQCGNSKSVANIYSKCNCGGLYVRTWNNATGSRNLFSDADY
jgi:hypothetical protein